VESVSPDVTSLLKKLVGVEKLTFHPKQPNWGDRKCLGDPTKSIVGHPDALLFLRISREGVFQQPRLQTVITKPPASSFLSFTRSSIGWRPAICVMSGQITLCNPLRLSMRPISSSWRSETPIGKAGLISLPSHRR